MYSYAYAPPTLDGERTRTVLAAGAGALVGFLAPKIMSKLQSGGMSPDQAQATTNRIIEGVIPPPKGALTAGEMAALQQVKSTGPFGLPTWAIPVGVGALVIGALAMRRR